jgi:fibronectin-binding autotransporter adhesin
LALDGHSEQINGLIGTGGATLYTKRVVENGAANPATLTFGDNDVGGNFLGRFTDGGAGALNITKIGAGAETLGGISDLSGTTTITGGTVAIDYNQYASSSTSSPTNYFSANSPIALAGGTLAVFGRADGAALPATAVSLAKTTTTITLPAGATNGLTVGQALAETDTSGGYIKAGTYIVSIVGNSIIINQATTNGATAGDTVTIASTAGSTSQSFKSLALTANSTLDFGNGGSGNTTVIHFTGAIANNGSTLTIANWNGVPDTGNGTEQLLFTGADASAFTSQFSQDQVVFTGFAPGYTTIQEGANFEVVPSTAPVPEPASLAMLGLGAAALLTRRRRA